MKKLVSASLAAFILFCLVIATEHPAYGYVDAGTGFIALQSLASVAAAGGYFLRRRISSLFARTEEEKVPVAAKQPTTAKAA